ncbi:MAG: CHAT domain-containing protein [Bryobacterales bacterium]|nr:CHAT domain-containing protein [Bryobacterales bacterium]
MRTVITVCCVVALSALLSGGWQERAEWSAPSDPSGSADLEELLRLATEHRVAARYGEAMSLFDEGHRLAVERRAARDAARFEWGRADTLFSRQRYRDALVSYLNARTALENLGEAAGVCAVDGNLASLYRHLSDQEAAIEAARRAAGCPAPDTQGRRRRILVTLGLLEAEQGNFESAWEAVAEGAAEADLAGDTDLAASAWDNLGGRLLEAGRLDQAEAALLAGYRLRKLHGLAKVEQSLRNLGILALERGDFSRARGLLDLAVGLAESRQTSISNLHFYEARGRLGAAGGDLGAARRDFGTALELARNQWAGTPGSRFARESAAVQLNRIARRYAGVAHLREGFEAIEESRAVSLAAHLASPGSGIPGEEPLLAALREAEVAMLRAAGDEGRAAMRRARERLLRAAGGGEPVPDHTASGLLLRVQERLGPDTVLFSFSPSESETWRWTVTSTSLRIHKLPGAAVLGSNVAALREAILSGGTDLEERAAALYATLFAGIAPGERSKPRWLLSLDAPLFDVPFAALREERGRYLAESVSLRIVSSAALYSLALSPPPDWGGPFVGLGDPIYNAADPRARGPAPDGDLPEFARLPGSGREIEAAALAWGGRATLLKGPSANAPLLRQTLAAGPSVVHVAAHVVRGSAADANALIALSGDGRGTVTFLSPVEIAAWRVAPGLVVLNGCGSGTAAASPGTGLMGLTHSWLMAGAGAVLATQWPTPDEPGVFFARFYSHLRSAPTGPGWRVADALQAAQRDMLQFGDWRSEPRYWAAFLVLGND